MTNLDSIVKRRDISLLTKVLPVKAMVFPVIMYSCEKGSEVKSLSRVQLFASPWTVAGQDPLSVEFSRQEYLSGLPFPPPEDLPNPGIEPTSPTLPGRFFNTEPLGKPDFM